MAEVNWDAAFGFGDSGGEQAETVVDWDSAFGAEGSPDEMSTRGPKKSKPNLFQQALKRVGWKGGDKPQTGKEVISEAGKRAFLQEEPTDFFDTINRFLVENPLVQFPLGMAKKFTWPADIVDLMGQGFAQQEMMRMDPPVTEEGDFDYGKLIEQRQRAQRSPFPTQEKIEDWVGDALGFSLEPQTPTGKMARRAGTYTGFGGKGALRDPGKLGKTVGIAGGVQGGVEAGLNETLLDLVGMGASGMAQGSKAGATGQQLSKAERDLIRNIISEEKAGLPQSTTAGDEQRELARRLNLREFPQADVEGQIKGTARAEEGQIAQAREEIGESASAATDRLLADSRKPTYNPERDARVADAAKDSFEFLDGQLEQVGDTTVPARNYYETTRDRAQELAELSPTPSRATSEAKKYLEKQAQNASKEGGTVPIELSPSDMLDQMEEIRTQLSHGSRRGTPEQMEMRAMMQALARDFSKAYPREGAEILEGLKTGSPFSLKTIRKIISKGPKAASLSEPMAASSYFETAQKRLERLEKGAPVKSGATTKARDQAQKHFEAAGKEGERQAADLSLDKLVKQYRELNKDLDAVYNRTEYRAIDREMIKSIEETKAAILEDVRSADPQLAQALESANALYAESKAIDAANNILKPAFEEGYDPQKLRSALRNKQNRAILERDLGKDFVEDLEEISLRGGVQEEAALDRISERSGELASDLGEVAGAARAKAVENAQQLLDPAFTDGFKPQKLRRILKSEKGTNQILRDFGPEALDELNSIAEYGEYIEKNVFEKVKEPLTLKTLLSEMTPARAAAHSLLKKLGMGFTGMASYIPRSLRDAEKGTLLLDSEVRGAMVNWMRAEAEGDIELARREAKTFLQAAKGAATKDRKEKKKRK